METYPSMPLFLETDRLLLRPWANADLEDYRELIAERGDGTPSVEAVREKIATQRAQTSSTGIALLAMRSRTDQRFIGYCGLVVGRATLSEPEIAYELLRRERGLGYATEAAKAVVSAAATTGRRRLWATIRAWNAPSLHVSEKIGFHRDHSTFDDRGEVVWMVRPLP